MPQQPVFLCHMDQLEEGVAKGFDPWGQGSDTVIAMIWQGKVRVYGNLCPHFGVTMQYRKDRFMSGDGAHIVCFAHGALFDPESGACVLGPCLGQALTAHAVRGDELGRLWLGW